MSTQVFRRITIFLALSAMSLSVQAQTMPYEFMVGNKPLSDAELQAAFKGVTHIGYYRFERGELDTRSFAETTHSDGAVEHVQGKEVLTGRWRINDDLICYAYDIAQPIEFCFNIYQVGNCYYHVAMTNGGSPLGRWTARSTPEGEEPNCEAPFT